MKQRAPQNRTLTCSEQEQAILSQALLTLTAPVSGQDIEGRVMHQDIFHAAQYLPKAFVDLLILDPPYNLSKNYNGHLFKTQEKRGYQDWFASILNITKPLLKSTATIYVCAEWRTSILIAPILEHHFFVRNRITWERDKGRGAKTNWKNNAEDIWFCTASEHYTFNLDRVKLKRQVFAPYRQETGEPKDWHEEGADQFRLTHPSNLWTDISIPFWSMPENTDHPTQKPEKLIAKLVLASSHSGDVVFDPFLGSGTSAVVAKKLNRHFSGVELNQEYCCWALKRLQLAELHPLIQGYRDGVFWERNTSRKQLKTKLSAHDDIDKSKSNAVSV